MSHKCPVCGKLFPVLYPHLWCYKRDKQFMCSYGCMRKYDAEQERKEEKNMMTGDKPRDRVSVAMEMLDLMDEGKDPLKYLEEIGYANPGQAYSGIRAAMRNTNEKLFNRFPVNLKAWRNEKLNLPKRESKKKATAADAMAGMKDAADKFFDECDRLLGKDEPEANKVHGVELPEEQKVTLPAVYEGMTIREVEGTFGRYRYSDIGSAEYIDFENADRLDVLSLTVDQWKRFREEQQKAARILGVEL